MNFFLLGISFEVGKTQDLPSKIWQALGDVTWHNHNFVSLKIPDVNWVNWKYAIKIFKDWRSAIKNHLIGNLPLQFNHMPKLVITILSDIGNLSLQFRAILNYVKLLEMNSFFTLHICLEVGKTQDLPSKIWQTLRDALKM
jgi:hypothetical protein